MRRGGGSGGGLLTGKRLLEGLDFSERFPDFTQTIFRFSKRGFTLLDEGVFMVDRIGGSLELRQTCGCLRGGVASLCEFGRGLAEAGTGHHLVLWRVVRVVFLGDPIARRGVLLRLGQVGAGHALEPRVESLRGLSEGFFVGRIVARLTLPGPEV
jgi:hypothetical protein